MHADDTTRPISCLCGEVAQDVLLDPTADHSTLNLCHCTDCRIITGMLYSSYYLLQTQPQKLDGLREYEQSDYISRYFCRTCGAHAFAHLKLTDQYLIAAGLVEKPPQVKSVRHWQVSETLDGGLSSFLPGESEDTASVCWLDALQANLKKHTEESSEQPHKDHNELQARCHCGGVELYITRPDPTSTKPRSPWPDLIVPYHSQSSENTEDVKWWLRDGNTKYLVGTCVCRSCRLHSGFPIQSWAFIPKSNILNSDKSPLVFNMGTMQQYESLPKIYREFCNRCGATVFWHCAERPGVIDVSTGLLRSESGVTAEDWLEWATGRASFAEMALDQEFIQRLEAGLKDWEERKQ